MTSVIVLFGSNIERERSFHDALQTLQSQPGLEVQAVSHVYESPAVGADGEIDLGRAPYHNAAFLLDTEMHVSLLRETLRSIENRLGRHRSGDKFADRRIDLDILGYGTGGALKHVDGEALTQMYAAVPAAEVAPDWLVAQTGLTLAEYTSSYFPAGNATLRRITWEETHRSRNCQ